MIKSTQGAHVFLFISAFINGANYSIAKNVMPVFIQPSGIIVIRGVATILTFFVLDFIWGNGQKIEKKDIGRIFACAVTGIVINQLFFYHGLKFTTPIHASLMMLMAPFVIVIITITLLKQTLLWNQYLGLAIAALGAGFLIFMKTEGTVHAPNMPLGDTLVFINAVSWGTFTVLVRPLVLKYHIFSLIKWIFLLGFCIVLPIGYSDVIDVRWESLTAEAWWSLGYLVVFGTILAYAFNTYFLKFVSPVIAGSYAYLQPVTAAIFSLWLGKESLGWEKVVAALVILAGLFLLNKAHKPQAPSES